VFCPPTFFIVSDACTLGATFGGQPFVRQCSSPLVCRGVELAVKKSATVAFTRGACDLDVAAKGPPPSLPDGLFFRDLFARHLEDDSVADLDGVVCEPFVEPAQ
jgi:hypothetical protein